MDFVSDLRLIAATAIADDRFCGAWFEGDAEDPYTILLSYDGRFPQPWARVDIPRRIVGIEAVGDGTLGAIYCALSDEGDVYTISGSRVETTKIDGAGIYSDDAVGYGPLNGLTSDGEALWAYGLGGQLYRNTDRWQRVNLNYEQFEQSSIVSGRFSTSGNGWFCGSMTPPIVAKGYKPDPELDRKIDEAARDGNFDLYSRLMSEAALLMSGGGPIGPTPLLLSLNSNRILRHEVNLGKAAILFDLYIESPSQIWAIGSEGTILFGSADNGFKPVTHAGGTTENLISITRFHDRFIIAGDNGLYEFDGHILTRIKPRLSSPETNRNVPTPLKIQSVGDMMMYFDYKHGICRWNGKIWDWVDIPKTLFKRNFNGLN